MRNLQIVSDSSPDLYNPKTAIRFTFEMPESAMPEEIQAEKDKITALVNDTLKPLFENWRRDTRWLR